MDQPNNQIKIGRHQARVSIKVMVRFTLFHCQMSWVSGCLLPDYLSCLPHAPIVLCPGFAAAERPCEKGGGGGDDCVTGDSASLKSLSLARSILIAGTTLAVFCGLELLECLGEEGLIRLPKYIKISL